MLSVAAMRLSMFNVYVEGEPEPGLTLIHNTFSGAYVVLDDESVAVLQRADRGEPLSELEREVSDDPDLRDPDVGIVVASHAAERADFEDWLERCWSRDVLELTVAINRACNFACSYCCQAGVLDGAVMLHAVADHVADWLLSYARVHGLSKIDLTFVGGEPLLHPARIRQIANRVRKGLEGTSTGFSFGVTTNGAMLTPALVAELVPLGLDRALVTLDGDETTHSLTRRAKNGEDTFARVFENALAASQRIQVSINGNYRTDTVCGFAPLLGRLADAGLPGGSRVCFSPALEALGAARTGDSAARAWASEDVATQVALYDETLRNGFDAPPLDAVGPCQFHSRHAFAIDVEGTILACPGFIGRSEWALGQVATGAVGRPEDLSPRAARPHGCGGCAYLPSCGGGCVAARLLCEAEQSEAHCALDYLVAVKRDALMRGWARDVAGEEVAPGRPEERVQGGQDSGPAFADSDVVSNLSFLVPPLAGFP